ncbi:hypothetical protein BASA81_000196 [Batrachochytrium salamandrivorans]|nr:hypothetical protein BASA81_000196 [Batrachochytrium salamandrivorans]
MSEATNVQMQAILSNLMGLKVADAFLEPVDWKNWGLLDYPQIVKKPMDLGTMETKLKALKYESFDQFRADLDLVVDNCLLFNEKSSEVYKQAVSLRKHMSKEIAKLGDSKPVVSTNTGSRKGLPNTPANNHNASVPSPPSTSTTQKTPVPTTATPKAPAMPTIKAPGVDDKDRFCRQLFALNAIELGKVMELMDDLCPTAIEAVGGDEVDLNVDNIDGNTFKRIDLLVREMQKKAKPSD